MQHIGIYAFRKQALLDFYSLPMQSLEASEKKEQLRYLEFENELKWSKRHMCRNQNRHAGRFRKARKNAVVDFRDRNSLLFYFGGKFKAQ
jgi:CMP-2-keto-3-deoxyoctulosonic acid synthetase